MIKKHTVIVNHYW